VMYVMINASIFRCVQKFQARDNEYSRANTVVALETRSRLLSFYHNISRTSNNSIGRGKTKTAARRYVCCFGG
jgi:hypothetical protein